MVTTFKSLQEPISVTDRVFETIQFRIQTLELAPGTKLSEADVAKQFGISRQPVRDAFYRLSRLGLLVIRPQRATEVSLISTHAIVAARFLRTATEVEMIRQATQQVTPDHEKELILLLDRQQEAIADNDTNGFKEYDDLFHRSICGICDLEGVWERISESKAHTDRLRNLSLRDGSEQALQDHRSILAALLSGDSDKAGEAMRVHLGRIKGVLDDLLVNKAEWFTDEPTPFG